MKTTICYRLVIILSMGFVLSLSACGNNEPTESDMFHAMMVADQHQRMFGDLEKLKAETKKSECEKVRGNAYKCGFVWKNSKDKAFPPILFIKVGEKWQVAI